ncbi:MAG: histidinol-phosphate transaminase [Clostridiales bacterium]|nr:histidinol-phosphate transaminase [Clostridiales bacterium]
MRNFLCNRVKSITPYTPGEQPKDMMYIKLNTNENPYPPSLKVLKAMKDSVTDKMQLYPDPESVKLRKRAATYYNVKFENIFVGNGSDEILALAFMAFYQDTKICYPEISYSFYPVYSNLYQVDDEKIPMNDNLTIDVNKIMNKNKGVLITNPNAPTGEHLNIETLEKIISSNNQNVVIIDEAYIDFGGDSVISLIDKYDNLLVIQTFSKSRSLAGLRIGIAFGSENLINQLTSIKNCFNSYPVDKISQVAAIASFDDELYFQSICQKIKNTRKYTISELEKLGMEVLPSKANFIFSKHKNINGEKLYLKLREMGILVRYFSLPSISEYVRITIGTKEQMDKLIKAIRKILK